MRRMMCLFLLLPIAASAQAPRLRSGATVFIEPSNGYELYLSAAFLQKAVPVIVVTDREKADYVIKTVVNGPDVQHQAVAVNNNVQQNSGSNDAFSEGWKLGAAASGPVSTTTASMSVIDRHTTQVVFAYSVEKVRNKQLQSAAESSAKALKEYISNSKR